MKNVLFKILTIATISCPLIYYGCSSPMDEIEEPNTTGELIKSIEKVEEITFHTKDIIVYDDMSKSNLTIRIASLNDYDLNEYISNTEITILPIYKVSINSELGKIDTPETTNQLNTENVDFNSSILTEVINSDLGAGVIGFEIKFKLKSINNRSEINGRTEDYNLQVDHLSPKWMDRFELTNYETSHAMDWKLYVRPNKLSGWTQMFNFVTLPSFSYTYYYLVGKWHMERVQVHDGNHDYSVYWAVEG